MEILIDFLKVLWMTASWPLRVALQASMACFLMRPTRRKLAPIVSITIGLGPTRLASLTEPIRTNMPNMKVQSLMLHAILCKEVFWTAIFSLSSCFKFKLFLSKKTPFCKQSRTSCSSLSSETKSTSWRICSPKERKICRLWSGTMRTKFRNWFRPRNRRKTSSFNSTRGCMKERSRRWRENTKRKLNCSKKSLKKEEKIKVDYLFVQIIGVRNQR